MRYRTCRRDYKMVDNPASVTGSDLQETLSFREGTLDLSDREGVVLQEGEEEIAVEVRKDIWLVFRSSEWGSLKVRTGDTPFVKGD